MSQTDRIRSAIGNLWNFTVINTEEDRENELAAQMALEDELETIEAIIASRARLADFARAVHALGDPATIKPADIKRADARLIETRERLTREDLAQ